jgi:hypothetical protein
MALIIYKTEISVPPCAVFSLEPLAQDLRESDIMDMRCVNLCTPLPFLCSALTEAWKPSCGDHPVWIIWRVYITKFQFGAGGKILSRNILRRGQKVRAGFTRYICVLLVHLCVIKWYIYIFCCTTKPASSSWTYIVSKKFYTCVIFLFCCLWNCVVFLELCCICLHFSKLPWGWSLLLISNILVFSCFYACSCWWLDAKANRYSLSSMFWTVNSIVCNYSCDYWSICLSIHLSQ